MSPLHDVLATIGIVTAASLAGLLVLHLATRYFEMRARRARERDGQAEEEMVAAKLRVDRAETFFRTYNFRPGANARPVDVCCKKVDPCARHVPQ